VARCRAVVSMLWATARTFESKMGMQRINRWGKSDVYCGQLTFAKEERGRGMVQHRQMDDLFRWERGRSEHPYFMWDSIVQAPRLLRECLGGAAAAQAKSVGERIRDNRIKRIYLLGCGTSRFAAVGIAHAMNSWAGLDADAYDAFEFAKYRRVEAGTACMAVALSHSGHTEPVVEAAERAKRMGMLVVSLTEIEDSPLAEMADMVIVAPGGRDRALPHTRSYLAALLNGYMMAAVAGGRQDLWNSLQRIPTLLERIRLEKEGYLKELAVDLSKASWILLAGGGPCASVASEIALKFMETALIPALGLEIESALRGPLLAADPDTAVIALSAPGPSREKVAAFMNAARLIGCRVVEVAAGKLVGGRGVGGIMVEAEQIHECAMPVLLAYPLPILVYWTALARRVNPDMSRVGFPGYREALLAVMPSEG